MGRSAFQLNGLTREVYFNQTVINNAAGPKVWYSDASLRRSREPVAIPRICEAVSGQGGQHSTVSVGVAGIWG